MRQTTVFLVLLVLISPLNTDATTIRISGSSWVHDAPTRIADANDYFAGDGPTITVTNTTSGKASLDRLMAGEVDFALAAAIPVAQALLSDPAPKRADPDDLVVLAATSLSNQTHHILAATDRGIRHPSNLAGRRVGVLKGTSAEFFWSLFAPLNNFDADSVELVDIPLESMAMALEEGSVDAIVTWDPWLYRQRRDADIETITFSDRQIYTLNWLLISHRRTVRDNPAVVDRILRGYLRAIETLQREPDRAVSAMMAAEENLPLDYVNQINERVIFHLGLNWSVVSNMEQTMDWLIDTRELTGENRPPPELYLAPGALTRVAPDRLMLPNLWQGEAF